MKLLWKCRLKKSHMEGVTLLLLLISPKLIPTPPFYVLFKTTLKKLQKETSIETQILMPVPLLLVIFLRPDGWWNNVLGLGLKVKNTNKKNFKCFGPWPFLLLMASCFACWADPSRLASMVILLWIWVVSCPQSWREFDHEFSTPTYNKVNLLSNKTVQEEKGKLDLEFLSVGSSEMEIL